MFLEENAVLELKMPGVNNVTYMLNSDLLSLNEMHKIPRMMCKSIALYFIDEELFSY